MTWTTAPESVQRARALLDQVGRDTSVVPYELAPLCIGEDGHDEVLPRARRWVSQSIRTTA